MPKVDYRTLLRHAGLPDSEVERIAADAEAEDRKNMAHGVNEADDTAAWANGVEKNIRLIARKTGVELEGNHAVVINGDQCELTVDADHGLPLAHLLHFANQIASAGIGSDVQIAAGGDLNITLRFQLVN